MFFSQNNPFHRQLQFQRHLGAVKTKTCAQRHTTAWGFLPTKIFDIFETHHQGYFIFDRSPLYLGECFGVLFSRKSLHAPSGIFTEDTTVQAENNKHTNNVAFNFTGKTRCGLWHLYCCCLVGGFSMVCVRSATKSSKREASLKTEA